MNVMVVNKFKDLILSLNIDVMKTMEGVFNVDEIIDTFANFYYDKMILDITAIRDYQNIDNLQKLAMNINMENVVILLDNTPATSSKAYLSKLISLGIYNFTNNTDGINYLLVHPHSYKDVVNIHNLTELCRINAINRQLAINEDANHLRSLGDVFITEPKNAGKLMRRAKETTVNSKGKFNRKKRFDKILSGSYDAQNGIALLDNFWEEIYSTRAAKEKSLAQTLRARRMSDGNLWKSTDGMSFFIREIGDSGLFLVMGKDVVFTDDVMQAMFATIVFLALLSTALCLIMASVMSSYLTAPIDRLTRTMQCVESGDLDARVE